MAHFARDLPRQCEPPLSRDLRDFGRPHPGQRLTPSVGRGETGCFPECHRPAVRLPESFRGGCSFGAGERSSGLFRKPCVVSPKVVCVAQRVNPP